MSPSPVSGIDAHAHVLLKDLPMVTDRHSPLLRDYCLPELLGELDAHGISHALLTAPSVYATDNSLLVGAIAQAPDRLKGTVILDPRTPMTALVDMNAQGICGVRLNWWRKRSLPDIREYRDLMSMMRELGWHLELFIDGVHMPEVLPVIRDTGVDLVLDHFGCPEPSSGVDGMGFRAMVDMVALGRAWVKLSAPYRLGGGDANAYARALLREAGPERLMWASDWPWGGFEAGMNYEKSLRWLDDWVPDAGMRHTILVETPAALFGFPVKDVT